MNLKEEIQKLVQLQEVDSQIYSFKSKKNTEIPEQLNKLKNDFEQKKKNFDLFTDKVKQLQLKKKEKELDLATKEENVKKAQGQLFQLKSNREYQARLTEIASLKADVSLLEEDVIKALDEIEIADKKAKEEKQALLDEEKKYKEAEAQLNSQLTEIDVKAKTLEDKKISLAKDIDKNILAKYERLIKSRSGCAMAEVNINTENCGACNMRVTSQKINEIKMYSELVLCENCVRILYLPEDFSL